MFGKSLELFFVDGNPEGLLTAEVFNWTGHVLSMPRTQLAKALKRDEAKYTGVYILLGEKDSYDTVYIGEGENIAERIKSHDSKKDWWSRVILITSKGNSLNKAHVQYLESRLIEIAKQANNTKLENNVDPKLPSINEAAKANMEQFLDYLNIVLPAIRVDVFQDLKKQVDLDTGDMEQVKFELIVRKEKIIAHAILSGSDFIVQKGSKARKEWIGKEETSYWRQFNELRSKGVISEENGFMVFTENYSFSSTSAAGAVITGRATAGPVSWKEVKTGKTYKEWEQANLENLD